MIADNGKHVIVRNGFGSFSVYPCTLENARRILSARSDSLPREIMDLVNKDPKQVYLVSSERMRKALMELVSLAPDEPGKLLRAFIYGRAPMDTPDERPQFLATQALKDEFTLWCVKNGANPLKPEDLSDDLLSALLGTDSLLVSGLKQRAAGRTIHIADDWCIETRNEWLTLTTGTWKDSAQEHRVVDRYMKFITDQLCHRDEKYEVCEFKATP